MKILYITTIGSTMGFFTSFIKSLLDEGHMVEIATNEKEGKVPGCYQEWGCTVYQIETSRSPLAKGNLAAIGEIRRLVQENKYDIVHCHTPVAAMCTRLACRKARKRGTKVFYTAHGFHFFKGAPPKNWLVYYPAEKICSYMTDVLITINKEDYALARRKMHAGRVEYVPGVGVDLEKFGGKQVDVSEKRKELGIPDGMIWLLAVGELIERKNHRNLICAVAELDYVFLTIVGQGDLEDDLEKLIDSLGVGSRVRLLGFRTDISELCEAADVFVFPSCQEGLPVALMEAMASGKPVVCSQIRGNTDLVDEGKGGLYFNPNNTDEIADAIRKMKDSDMGRMGRYNREKMKHYGISNVMRQNREIYELAAACGGVFHLTELMKRMELRESIGVRQDAVLLLSVGELNENKNHEVVIRAMARLKDRKNCPALYYAVAGEGPRRQYLKQLISALGLVENVKLLGFRADVCKLYAAADIFCFPSRREGLGLAAIEAMASGLPLVTSNVHGINDYSEDGVTGYKCAPEDAAGFAASIRILAEDEEKRAWIGRANAEKVKMFSARCVCGRMEEIYRGIREA